MDQDKKVTKGAISIMKKVEKLEPQEFLGVCKVLGIKIYDIVEKETGRVLEEEEYLQARARVVEEENMDKPEDKLKEILDIQVRPAEILIGEVVDKICALNRTQRRNFLKILNPAVKGR